jgi:hypothetical protein
MEQSPGAQRFSLAATAASLAPPPDPDQAYCAALRRGRQLEKKAPERDGAVRVI